MRSPGLFAATLRPTGRRAAVASAATALLLATGTGIAGASAGPAAASTSHGASVHHPHAWSVPARDLARHDLAPAAAGSDMQYGGGPIQTSPVVYLDFWGSQWDSDTNGIPAYLAGLFQGLGASGDNWSTITSQYTDGSGNAPTFTGAVYGGSWTDDASAEPSNPSAADIGAEADSAAAQFGVAGNPNAQIIVVSAQGTHPDGWPDSGFCAWHDYTGSVSYTNLPYELDAPAGSRCPNGALGGKLDAFSIVAGHEYAETITDPQPSSGWVAPDGTEIGDGCESGFQSVTLSTGTFAMQPLWSNAAGGCVISSS